MSSNNSKDSIGVKELATMSKSVAKSKTQPCGHTWQRVDKLKGADASSDDDETEHDPNAGREASDSEPVVYNEKESNIKFDFDFSMPAKKRSNNSLDASSDSSVTTIVDKENVAPPCGQPSPKPAKKAKAINIPTKPIINLDSDDDGYKSGDELQNEPAPKITGEKGWPQLKTLFSKHPALCRRILQACDDCNVYNFGEAKEAACNVKKNGWSRLNDVFWGNGSNRGLLAGILPSFDSVPKLKAKIIDLWKHGKNLNQKGTDGLPSDILAKCVVQLSKYNKTREDKAAALEKEKAKVDLERKQMKEVSRAHGTLPPGAKGLVDAGMIQHSTNLHLDEPASHHYANKHGSTSPKTPKKTKIDNPDPSSSVKIHEDACSEIKEHSNMLMQVMRRNYPTEAFRLGGSTIPTPTSDLTAEMTHDPEHIRLQERAASLMGHVKFLKEMKDDNDALSVDEYKKAYSEYIKANGEFMAYTATSKKGGHM